MRTASARLERASLAPSIDVRERLVAVQAELEALLADRPGDVPRLTIEERPEGWELQWAWQGDESIPLLDELPERFLRVVHDEQAGWLSEAERLAVTRGFQAPPRDYPATPVHALFSSAAAAHPARTAIVFGSASMTYGELDARANRIACSLVDAGVAPGERIGLHAERSFDLVAAMLGILKAGAVYVPLDPGFPAARLAMIVDDCGPGLILASPTLVDAARQWGRAVSIEECAAAAGRDGDPCIGVSGDANIYIIYTSGSTGRPKGIPQTHRAIANLVQWELHDSGVDHTGVVLQFSSLGFDVHLQEIFATLAAGGTICLIDHDDRLDPDRLLAVLERQRVTTVFLSVSSLTNLFVGDASVDPLPPSLRHIVTAGEQLVIGPMLRDLLLARPELAIHNHYGVSESHVVTAKTVRGADSDIPARPNVGRPIANCRVEIRDTRGRLVPAGVSGEVWIFGVCLSDPYLDRPEQSALRFRTFEGERCFVTGDRARWLPNGEIQFLGRLDDQVKIRGHLVEIAEVEAVLLAQADVSEAAVIAAVIGEQRRLCAFVTGRARPQHELRQELAQRLPDFMVPSVIRFLESMPIGPTGKIDRAALAALAPAAASKEEMSFAGGMERLIAEALAAAMGTGAGELDVEANLFDLGAESLDIIRAARTLSERLGTRVSPLQFFAHNSVRALAAALEGRKTASAPGTAEAALREPVAIVGMAGRFPGADNIAELWEMLVEGRDGLTVVAPEELDRSMFSPLGRSSEPRVTRLGLVRDSTGFDAGFFGYSRYEADWIDPQQRLFLECAHEALEDAGCDPARYRGTIGIIAGAAESTYVYHLRPHVASMPDYLHAISATDKDFVATRAAYKLGLTGPAYGLQTACSTSAVAVHLACNVLAMGEADVMLAGATSVQSPQRSGYAYDDGSIYSRDGHTRPFDEAAGGTNMSNGVGVVVLKRLSRAVEDRDHVYAVILGTAVNNDGARKVGFAAPSVQGQEEVIRAAIARAGIDASSIDYIEAHGTGTALGDPIEVEALRRTYGAVVNEPNRIALGSIKSNIGHTNRTAGVAGVIKAALVLRHRKLVPTLHYGKPNPALELQSSPLWIPTATTALPRRARPYRAAVSALGIGGTNAHLILEEVPPRLHASASAGPELLLLSARTAGALRELGRRVAGAMRETPLADAAFTLATGRRQLSERAFVVAANATEAASALESLEPQRAAKSKPRLVWMFPGQGAEVVGTARTLYDAYPEFRSIIDHCAEAASEALGLDLRTLLFPSASRHAEAAEMLARSRFAQPATVALEIATAKLWRSLGVEPDAVMGHSTGQYAAAVWAGVLEVETAMRLLATRGRLMEEAAEERRGVMISALLDGADAESFLDDGVHLAGWNARGNALFAGAVEPMLALERRLVAEGIRCSRLSNPNPNHTPLMQPMVDRFASVLAECTFSPPRLPLIANDSGGVANARDICTAEFWLRHVRMPVLFARSFDCAYAQGVRNFIEVGPSRILSGLALHHFTADPEVCVISSFPAKGDDATDPLRVFLGALGQWWTRGGEVDWDAVHARRSVARVSLPAYPFEHSEHWLPIPDDAPAAKPVRRAAARPQDWLYRETWERTRPTIEYERGDLSASGTWIIFDAGGEPLAAALRERLTADGCSATVARSLDAVAAASIDPIAGLIVLCTRAEADLAALARAAAALPAPAANVLIVTRDASAPERAGLRAFARVLEQENADARCRLLDVGDDSERAAVAAILSELAWGEDAMFVARSGARRLVPAYERIDVQTPSPMAPGRQWLLTGGLGRVGSSLAERLARTAGARLVLLGRTALAALRPQQRAAFDRIREAANGNALYIAADCTDAEALARALRGSSVALDDIAYIVHAAAEIDRGAFHRPLAQMTAAELGQQLAPKRGGVRALEEVFRGQRVERAWLFSSVAALLGGVGYCAYSAANLIAAAEARQGALPWQVIAWDVWTRAAAGEGVALGSSLRGQEMPEEGALDAFALACGVDGDVIVSTTDLATRIAETRRIARDAHDAAGAVADRELTVEEALMQACQRVIGRRPETLEMSLTAFGGDSLAATQLVLAMTSRLGVQIPIGELLTATTLAQFCERARFYRTYRSSDGAPMVLQPSSGDGPYRTSVLQDRWFTMEERGYGYLEFVTLIEGALDVQRFVRAIQSVCRRHDVLRSRYERTADGLRQVLSDDVPHVEVRDAVVEPHEGRFDLLRESPLRISLTRIDDETHLLFILTHHIAFDGWSSTIFLDDLGRAYADDAPLARGLQYSDFAAWQHAWRRSQAFQSMLGYWSRQFAGAPPPLRIRPDVERAGTGRRGAKVHRMIPAATGKQLSAAAESMGTTVFALLVTSYLAVLSRESGSTDLVIGTTSNGRHVAGAEDVLGVFVNPLPVRFTIDPEATLAAAATSVHERLIGFHDHQRVVLADLREHVEAFRGLDINHLFRVYILYQNYPSAGSAGSLRFTVPEVDDVVEHPLLARFAAHETTLMRDLELVIVPHGQALSCNFWYRSDLYSEARVARWADELCELASAFEGDGTSRLFGELIGMSRCPQ